MTYAKSFENQFFSNIFTFLSVIYPNFEYFHINTQKSTEFDIAFLKNYSFILNLLIKIILGHFILFVYLFPWP